MGRGHCAQVVRGKWQSARGDDEKLEEAKTCIFENRKTCEDYIEGLKFKERITKIEAVITGQTIFLESLHKAKPEEEQTLVTPFRWLDNEVKGLDGQPQVKKNHGAENH